VKCCDWEMSPSFAFWSTFIYFWGHGFAKPLMPKHPLLFPHRKFACHVQIILSQEKNIQQLNQLIESLQRQLLHCRGSNNTVHAAAAVATEASEVDGHEVIEDENRR
jgi:hypothetical protein